MKTQIEQQRVRLRIGEHELGRLLAAEAIDNITALAPGIVLHWRLALADIDAPELRIAHDIYRVRLPREAFEAFAHARPRRDGTSFEWADTGDAPLEISVEIDVRDSHRRARNAARGNDREVDSG